MDALEQMIQRMKQTHTQTSCSEQSADNVCQICNGTGWESYKEGKYEILRECKCGIRQKQMMNSKLSFANLPETFKDIRIESFDVSLYTPEEQKKAKVATKAVKYWLDNFEQLKERGMGNKTVTKNLNKCVQICTEV